MKLQLGPEVISSYKRLAYQAWYALAEFVDNSTQSYFNNRQLLDGVYAQDGDKLTVKIVSDEDDDGQFIRIEDNSIGMSHDELANAVYVGRPPLDTRGRSRYGLGLKTGASWFGDLWTIETKKLSDLFSHKVTVDVLKVASGDLELPYKKTKTPKSEHWTTIEIRKLHRKMSPRTVAKVKSHLRSLYRRDLSKGQLILKVNSEVLAWDADIDKRLLTRQDGHRAKETFQFKIGGKQVSGWAGVLERGSRSEAGFSIIQADRVIMGWPESYRPETIFGEQEGGTNDLVNQRLFGELVLEGFEVSHTKDQILFDDGEKEILEAKLKDRLTSLRQLALSHRKDADERIKKVSDSQRNEVLNRLEKEIKLDKVQNFFKTFVIPPNSLIKKSNQSLKDAIVKRFLPDLTAKIDKTEVCIYMVRDMSPNDPYVIIESTKRETSVIVIINLAHPHWMQLTNQESILNFVRHCTYDGVSECKAYFMTGKMEPDTIKLLKDNLLRIPMSIGNKP